ncbi:hypothetical protein KIPE111705_06315 [Kibdelosporangium persicum]|uniref:hypothetical protein n=1 Tax=Kibdelosporangium persicum TaxID=2698649 RepID=UPI001564539C|nr:hypothetical protein [Kibdelosporangium persicum]
MRIFGGIEPVELRARDELLASLDAEPDPAGLAAALDKTYRRDGGALEWIEVNMRRRR